MIRAADLFCGAGGASTGLARACEAMGERVELTAINHWDVAVETHAANHPWAQHLCETLDSVDPRKVIRGGRLDVLLASPECTHHSIARGGKPVSDQSRATAWHVLRWAEALRPSFVCVENVPEFRTWGPLGSNGRPLVRQRGQTFRAWVQALESLGYAVEHRILNAADFGAATTRRRLFVMARLVGGRRRDAVIWPQETHAERPDLFGRVKWRAAREVIDWSLEGRSIFHRDRPLAENTLKRIAAGARKFWGVELEPFLVAFYGHNGRRNPRVHHLDAPLPTVPTSNRFGLVEPFVLQQQSGGAPRAVGDPMPTVATKGAISLIEPVTAGGQHLGVAEPFLVQFYGSGSGLQPRTIHRPLPTVTARDRFGLVEPAYIDVRFRMLAPHELAAGMGFPAGYRFAGNREAQVRQIGNAVEVNQAEALCRAMLTAQRRRAA